MCNYPEKPAGSRIQQADLNPNLPSDVLLAQMASRMGVSEQQVLENAMKLLKIALDMDGMGSATGNTMQGNPSFAEYAMNHPGIADISKRLYRSPNQVMSIATRLAAASQKPF